MQLIYLSMIFILIYYNQHRDEEWAIVVHYWQRCQDDSRSFILLTDYTCPVIVHLLLISLAISQSMNFSYHLIMLGDNYTVSLRSTEYVLRACSKFGWKRCIATKLEEVVPEVHAAIQRDMNRLKKWNNKKLTASLNAKSCTWGGITPSTRTCWKLSSWKAALQERPRSPGEYELEYESVVCPYHKKGSYSSELY